MYSKYCFSVRHYVGAVDWDESLDPYYQGLESELDTFATEHWKEIRNLRNMTVLDYPILKIDARLFMGKLLRDLAHRKIQDKEKIERAGELAARYHVVMADVLDRGLFGVLRMGVEKCFPERFSFQQRRKRSGEQEMLITTPQCYNRDWWPIFVEITQIEESASPKETPIEWSRVRLRVHRRGFHPEENDANAMNAVLQLIKKRPTSRQNVMIEVPRNKKRELDVSELEPTLALLLQLQEAIDKAVVKRVL